MALWSTKRRLVYGGGFLLTIGIVLLIVFFSAFNRTPTCTDGIANGGETGVDCGGACKNLCSSEALNPVVIWAKVFNISGDVYSAVAYVENPNVSSKNAKANYTFRIFDANNDLITVKDGQTSIPKGRKFAIFENGIVMKGSKPKSAEFKFTAFSPWEKDTQKEPTLTVTHGNLMSANTTPRVEGTVRNDSLVFSPNIELTVFVLDSKENVVASSHTFIDKLASRASQDFVFTWPKPFSLGSEACTNPLDVAVALDTSSSMGKESLNPVEPWTTVKTATAGFIRNLTDDSKVSIISFDSIAKEESPLSLDKNSNIFVLENIAIASTSTTEERVNITNALTTSFEEFAKETARKDSKKVLVLLTDSNPKEPTLAGTVDYPLTSAQFTAKNMAENGITIYTIGLGNSISADFLKSLSGNSNYFFAPTKESLRDSYSKILSSICTKKSSVVNIIYRPI